jgi:hypothetical protein
MNNATVEWRMCGGGVEEVLRRVGGARRPRTCDGRHQAALALTENDVRRTRELKSRITHCSSNFITEFLLIKLRWS